MADWLSFYNVKIDKEFDPGNIEELKKLPFSVPIPKSMDRSGQINIDFTKPIDLGSDLDSDLDSRRLYKGNGEHLAYRAFFKVELNQQEKEP